MATRVDFQRERALASDIFLPRNYEGEGGGRWKNGIRGEALTVGIGGETGGNKKQRLDFEGNHFGEIR